MKKDVYATIFAILSLLMIRFHIFVSFLFAFIAMNLGYQARKESGKKSGNFGYFTGIIVMALWIVGASVFFIQLYRWDAQRKVVEDQKYCEDIKTAVTVMLMDPEIISDEESVEFISRYIDGEYYSLRVLFEDEESLRNDFNIYLQAATRDEVTTYGDVQIQLQSEKDAEILFKIEGELKSPRVTIIVQDTDIIAY